LPLEAIFNMTKLFATLGLLGVAATGASAVALGAYNVDPNSVSVSGLSSGGFMAAQLGVAYSDVFKTGFGVFAAGPYDCARNNYVCYFGSN
jgi:predicted peptidase